jgi:hypothetical protein
VLLLALLVLLLLLFLLRLWLQWLRLLLLVLPLRLLPTRHGIRISVRAALQPRVVHDPQLPPTVTTTRPRALWATHHRRQRRQQASAARGVARRRRNHCLPRPNLCPTLLPWLRVSAKCARLHLAATRLI